MFFPFRHDRRLRSTPWLTISLIALNAAVFIATTGMVHRSDAAQMQAETELTRPELWAQFPVLKFYLWPAGDGFAWWQLFSAAFLHADFMHLAGNMLFLWIFGGAVEDRLGKIGFLALYGAGAAASGGLYLATSPAGPMLGASGAIAAVSGAFLVLFPQVRIQIVYWFLMIGSFELPGLWVMLAYFGMDVFSFLSTHGRESGGGVAYAAHIGGFVLGFLVAAGLLATRILPREPQWDLLAMLQHWRRREQFRSLSRTGSAWHKDAGMVQPAAAKSGPQAPPIPPMLLARREGIFHFAARGQLQEAAAAYGALLDDHPDQVLPEQTQHDLAGLLMQNGAHAQAAQAFRLLLRHYPRRADRAQTQLLLALLCRRYLGKNDEAQVLLAEALPKLEGAEKAMAEGLLGA